MKQRAKLALQHQMESRNKIERLFRTRLRTLFRKEGVGLVYRLLKGNYLGPEDLQSLRADLRKSLEMLYARSMKLGVTTSHRILAVKEGSFDLEIKRNNLTIRTNLTRLERSIKDRIDSEISDFVSKSTSRITSSFLIELNSLVTRVYKKVGNVQVSERDLKRYIEFEYRKLVDRKAVTIAVTETTRGIEQAKLIAAEELALDAIEFDEEALDEDQQELLAELSLLAEEGDPDAFSLLLAGGAASLLAIAGITKTWVAVMDDSTREAHADADGETVSIEESFSVDGEDLEYPGDDSGSPGNTINCRCTVIYNIE